MIRVYWSKPVYHDSFSSPYHQTVLVPIMGLVAFHIASVTCVQVFPQREAFVRCWTRVCTSVGICKYRLVVHSEIRRIWQYLPSP